MKNNPERVGIFGGTFNPPHVGHLMIAEHARETAQLERVLFVPAFQPPHKIGREIIAPHHRLEMTRLAIKGNRSFEVSDVEIRQKGISYTVDTIRLLRSRLPDADLYLILGADSLAEYESWKEPGEIRSQAQLLVYPRGNQPVPHASHGVEFMKGPGIGISSTEIRGRVAMGRSIRYYVPALVGSYIKRHRLYLSVEPGTVFE